QDQVISPQITLWNQQGSQVIQGTLLVVPVEESLLYIRPLYLRASGGRIPELKRVIVAYQNNIVMEETLAQGLERIFGSGPRPGTPTAERAAPPVTQGAAQSPAPVAPSPELAALAEQARQHYENAIKAQREGNWALYGEEIRRLGDILRRMQR
ncbi:MAG: UPF0182 family protein, partial [Acidobacteria bacterium]|nr:UPF0182 family protein [Acidobacteriota bacterium]